MAIEIVDLPINSMVDLSIVFCMFTRGYFSEDVFFGAKFERRISAAEPG